jgi:hypothetical protein
MIAGGPDDAQHARVLIDHWSLMRSAIAYYLFMALFMATGAALVLWLLSD